MIITRKAIDRRTLLRGAGAALALPLLDGMVPALTAFQRSAARPKPRFGVVYVPNGIVMEQWTPTSEGTGVDFPRILKPLEPFRDRAVVISGLKHGCACQGGGHIPQGPAFLTGVAALSTTGNSKLQLGVSMDQVAADGLGKDSAIPSLELSLEGTDSNVVATCSPGFSCAYLNISWRNETTPLPRETNPRHVFERLFGDGGSTDGGARQRRLQENRSLLDSVGEKVGRLKTRLSAGDRAKLDAYLSAVRDVEQRLQRAEKLALTDLPVVESPAGIPLSYDDHARLMFDLQVLAYQADITRVISFMVGRELSGATYPQIGVADSHHPITHHGGDAAKIEKVAKINTYHATLFAYYVDKLRGTQDGEGTLLDNLLILYGGGIGDGNTHAASNLPVLLVGGAGGQLKGNRHLRYPGERITNMEVTVLNRLGIPVERFGDSTGALPELAGL